MKRLPFLALALSLLLPQTAGAVRSRPCTDSVCHVYVDPDVSGGDGGGSSWANAYASLSAAEDAEDAYGDIVSDTDDIIFHCKSSGGSDDTTTVAFDGWTTSATYDITIQVDEADRHAGSWAASKYIISSSSSPLLAFGTGSGAFHANVYGLQFDTSSTTFGHSAMAFVSGTANQYTYKIGYCIIQKSSGSGNGQTGILMGACAAGSTVTVFNTIIYGFDTSTSRGIFNNDSDSTVYVYNSTIAECLRGVYTSAGSTTVTNSAVFNTSTADLEVSGATITYTATDDTYAGTGNVDWDAGSTDWAANFTDYAAYDFHLKSTAPIIGSGTNDPGSGLYSDDIDGDTRSSTWDIGADEYVSAGPAALPQVIRINVE